MLSSSHLARARVGHSQALREAMLAAAAALAYFGIRNATAGSEGAAFANARRLVDFERSTHVAWEHGMQSFVLRWDVLTTAANWVYIWGHWPVIIVSAVLLYRHCPARYVLLRNTMFVSAAIGFVFFAFLPVAPPRLFDPEFVDTVTLHSDAYRALQPPALTNQYAAFPSLHFGWDLLVGIALWGATRNVPIRILAVAAPVAMGLAVVVTANHFVVDVAGGLAVVMIALALVQFLPGTHK